MAKIALLIGVSEYQNGLNPLPSAVKDIEAMGEVFKNPNRGGFDSVQLLPNPSRQKMEEAIYQLFANRQKDDLVLFYFSGHGVNPSGHLFLATPQTRQEKSGEVVPTTAVTARYVQEQMNGSLSKRQVVILDCCFSGAFAKGMTVKGDGMANLQAQLGGKGRAILTSSSATEFSFPSEDSELSIYTRYLVEGIKTGAADRNDDGKIDAEELHDYASEKVTEASPAMTPKFYPVEDGSRIYLAKSPQDDPQLKYRKAVQELVREDEEDIDFLQGEIDYLNRCYLDELQQKWGITADVAADIEGEVMEPLRQRQLKLKQYEEVLAKAVKQGGGALRDRDWRKLKRLQGVLELRDEDVEPIVARIVPKPAAPSKPIPKPKPIPKTPSPETEVELKSAKGADYTQLRDLLAAQKWKEADEETARVMLQVANREKEGYLDLNAINNFPCEDLQTIDGLWVYYSNGRFGFSVQKRIWEELGGKVDVERMYEFCDRVGWKKGEEWVNYSDLNFSLEARSGHLPSDLPLGTRYRVRIGGVLEFLLVSWWVSELSREFRIRVRTEGIFSRAKTCLVKFNI